MKKGETFVEKKNIFTLAVTKKQQAILKQEAKKKGISMANYLRMYGMPKENEN